jgi:ABC-2 type transport system ATP-binding protein
LFFGRIYGMNGPKLKERMQTVLEIVGLAENRGQLVRTFSGGMKRRLNFAVGVLHNPKLVILDEPTVGVDPQSRTHLLDCIRNLSREKVAVIYCSHYMEEIEALCHRVAIMDHGKLLACGTLDALLDRNRADLLLRVTGWSQSLVKHFEGFAEIETLGEHQALLHLRRNRRDDADGMAGKLASVLEQLRQSGAQLQKIETKEHNLERLFLELTGRRLRD